MEKKLVVITAENVNTRTVNRLLLSLRDWEFSDEPEWDDCHIVRTTKIPPPTESHKLEDDKPPLQEFSPTEFHGKSIQEVESMMLSKHKAGADSSLFLLLDSQGVRDETIIVAERAENIGESEDEERYLDKYNKVRVPWIETHAMWANLSVANMEFESFCADDQEPDEERWFTYQNMMGEDYYNPFLRKRDNVLRALRKLDLA